MQAQYKKRTQQKTRERRGRQHTANPGPTHDLSIGSTTRQQSTTTRHRQSLPGTKYARQGAPPRPRLVSLPHSLSPHRLPKSSFFGSALRCFDVSLATWSTIISEVAIPCRVAAPTGSEHAHPPGSAATGLSRKKELAGLISLRPAKQTTTTPRAHYVFVKIYLSIPYFQSTHLSQSHRASQDPCLMRLSRELSVRVRQLPYRIYRDQRSGPEFCFGPCRTPTESQPNMNVVTTTRQVHASGEDFFGPAEINLFGRGALWR
jgi:hypothetical protein